MRNIYQNQLAKACFQHFMAYGDFRDLNRRIFADKVFRDKACHIAKDPKYDGYQRGLATMVYTFFDKKTSGSGIKIENASNKEIAQELHKLLESLIKVHSPFIDNIWGADLADM